MLEDFATFVFWLVVGHFVCDVPLQGHYLASLKRRADPAGAGGRWVFGLSCHSMIHAGSVALITGSVRLGMLEFICHWLIDYAKCEGAISMKTDQAAHLGCKLIWAAVAVVIGAKLGGVTC